MTALEKLLLPERIVELRGLNKDEVLEELVDVVARAPGMPARDTILAAVREREELMPTAIGSDIAIPHCKDARMKSFAVALGRSETPIDWGSSDAQPVRIVALIVAPDTRQDEYLRLLSRVTKLLKSERGRILEIKNVKDVHEVVHAY